MTTKAEKAHMNRVAELGCVVCRNMGYSGTPAEIHHIKNGNGIGRRASHFETLPLCFHHHSAQGQDGYHKAPRDWEIRHGSQLDLLEQVRGML